MNKKVSSIYNIANIRDDLNSINIGRDSDTKISISNVYLQDHSTNHKRSINLTGINGILKVLTKMFN